MSDPRDKMRKLFALAVRETTPDMEALNAFRKGHAIAAKHGIELFPVVFVQMPPVAMPWPTYPPPAKRHPPLKANLYPGICMVCSEHVETGMGFIVRAADSWRLFCKRHRNEAKAARSPA